MFDWIAFCERVQLVSSGNKLTLTVLCIQWSLSCIKTHLYPTLPPAFSRKGFARKAARVKIHMPLVSLLLLLFLFFRPCAKNLGCVNYFRISTDKAEHRLNDAWLQLRSTRLNSSLKLCLFAQKGNMKERNNIILTPNEVCNFYCYDTFECEQKVFPEPFALVFYE